MLSYIKENILSSKHIEVYSEKDNTGNHIALLHARLCCSCDTIHDGSICPKCESKQFISVNNIVKSLK